MVIAARFGVPNRRGTGSSCDAGSVFDPSDAIGVLFSRPSREEGRMRVTPS